MFIYHHVCTCLTVCARVMHRSGTDGRTRGTHGITLTVSWHTPVSCRSLHARIMWTGACSIQHLIMPLASHSLCTRVVSPSYLQENSFTHIAHLSSLTLLNSLNLNQNGITSISGLSTLTNLNTLLLQRNKLCDVEQMQGLVECPSIA